MANFNFNKAILGGRLTSDPEVKKTQSDISVASFSIAVNRRYAKQGDAVQADYINCVAWRQQAEFIGKYFRKGSSICIVGNIQTRSWQDQQGNKRYTTEVIVDEVMFVDSKGDSPVHTDSAAPAPAYSTPMAEAPKFEEVDDDDLPF